MRDVSLLSWLSMVTLVLVAAIGVALLIKNRRSQAKRGEHPGGIAGPE